MFLRSLSLLLPLIAAMTTARADAGACTSAFVPPPDEYDWIQLTSDEWLKGELISLFDDELTFDSDELGVLRLDWEDVRCVRGHGEFGVSIQGIDSIAGTLEVRGEEIFVTVGDQTYAHTRANLVAIAEAADRELDRWSGELALGVNVSSGNTDVTEYNMLTSIQRRTPRSRGVLDYIGNFNETEGERVANNHRVNGAFDVFSGGRLFWRPIFGQYFRDPFQNIEHQGTVETGLGFKLVETTKTEWDVSGGVGVNFVTYDSVVPGQESDKTSPALTLATDFETELTSWIDYELVFQMTFLDNDSGSYQHHLLTTLSTDLIGDLDLDVSFVWDRTEKPQPTADGEVPEKDDYRFLLGVGFEF